MWKTVSAINAFLVLTILVIGLTDAGRNGAANRKTKGGAADPNCSTWTYGACVVNDGKTCGKGKKQGTRTGDSCQVKTQDAPCSVPCPKCLYNKADWQPCNAAGQITRVLTVKSGQPATCEATKTITKPCAKNNKKGGKKQPVCKYNKKADWTACINGKMTRTLTLKGRKVGCEVNKVETKDCKVKN